MSALGRHLGAVILSLALLLAGGLWLCHYGAEQYQDGYAAAVEDSRAERDRAATMSRKTESDLRAQLHAKDAEAFEKEEEYEANLAAAQRRVRAGTDRLRCPVGQVPAAPATNDRPATGGPGADGAGPNIVPAVAEEILGDAADVARLVRKYERVVERFDACRAVNAGP